jgi:beta-phosphoglucomutase
MKQIKAVIFDFNGTLYWDTPFHNEAWDRFLEMHRISLTAEEKRHKIHGKLNRDILSAIFKRDMDGEELTTMVREKELMYQEICLQHPLILAPGATDLLDLLKSKRIFFTVATAADKINIDFYFRTLNLHRWFRLDKIIYDDGSFRGKPNPDIFFKAMNTLNAEPAATLIFEDSLAGIRAAENAGAGKIIIVNSHNVDYSEWPYQVIRDFREVDRKLFVKG